jgi:hypothetical protein
MGYFTVDGKIILKFIKYEVEDGIEVPHEWIRVTGYCQRGTEPSGFNKRLDGEEWVCVVETDQLSGCRIL